MGGGAYWTRGNCTPVTDRIRFGVDAENRPAKKFQVRKTDPEVQAVTGYTGAAAYVTRPYCIRPCNGFSVITNGATTCAVQVSSDPVSGVWRTIDTLTDLDSYATSDTYDWIRFSLTNSTAASVWLNRSYPSY